MLTQAQQTVIDEMGTPIFDELASEAGLDWSDSHVDWFDAATEADVADAEAEPELDDATMR